jgi:heat shock protein HslJ
MRTSILFLILLFLIGCERKDTSVQPLLKTQWFLSSIQNTKTNEITNFPTNLSPHEYIIFTDSLNTLKAGGVCNGCIGAYSINSDLISTTGLTCTQIYCSKWEDYFFDNLDSMFHYEINGNLLTIYSKGTYNLNLSAK